MRYLILFFSTLLFASNVIIQYPNLKKSYYLNQIINLKIKMITPQNMHLAFIPPYNTEINVTKPSNLIYILKLKFKNDNKLKKLFVIGKNFYKEIDLNNLYKTKNLEKIPGFCNVLADDLNITNIIASKYDSKFNTIAFTITAKNANLKDFNLNSLKDENLTLVNNDKATFFGLIDKNKKNLTFYYFNTDIDNYKKITVPVNIKEETISTQTNLNPEDNTLFTPVNILLLALTAFLIIVFLVYQKIILLIPPILLFSYLVYKNLPKGTMYVQEGTKVYILPTKNSTNFYTIPKNMYVKILKKQSKYTKIEVNNKIGWIKNENN